MRDETRPASILLVEDNEGDIELTKEAFEEAKISVRLDVVEDGDLALDFLNKRGGYEDAQTPDLILLDLNLPRTSGREVLEVIKSDSKLKCIPVVVLTSSSADKDVMDSYGSHANCYIVKPVDAEKFIGVVAKIEDFWVQVVVRPKA